MIVLWVSSKSWCIIAGPNKINTILDSIDIAHIVAYEPAQEHQPEQLSSYDGNSLIEKIKRIYLKHPMSLACLVEWVKLLNTVLEECERFPQGKEEILELFRQSGDFLPDIFLFVKCNKCKKSTKIRSDEKQSLKCCDEPLKTNETNFFVILPIKKQIEQSLKNNWSEISSFDTSGANSDSYEDVHDGAILRKLLDEYKDSDINILSLCLNVDGANKFKSNSFSVWPIQLMQNFLPPHIRFLPENIILNGLFYHKSKDDNQLCFHQYMRPLIDELAQLDREPIELEIGGELFKFKPVVTHCAIDLPAKSKIQETKQFGGYNACTYCHILGDKVLIETQKKKTNPSKLPLKKSGVMTSNHHSKTGVDDSIKKARHYVRYLESECPHKMRDEIETLEKMLAASEFDKGSIDGIKGKIQM